MDVRDYGKYFKLLKSLLKLKLIVRLILIN